MTVSGYEAYKLGLVQTGNIADAKTNATSRFEKCSLAEASFGVAGL